MGRILVAHDNAHARQTLRDALEQQGHWVIEAGGFPQLSDRVLSHQPDLIITRLPLVGELTRLTALLKKVTESLPVIVLANAPVTDGEKTGNPRLSSNITFSDENFSASDISGAVRNLLERSQAKSVGKGFLRFGHLELNRQRHSVRLGVATKQNIPERFFELIWLLAKRASESEETCDRRLIIAKLWKKRVRDREVDVTISRLKSRVPFLAPFIESLPGKGYRLALPVLELQPSKSKP